MSPQRKPVDTSEFWRQRMRGAPDFRRVLWQADDAAWDRMEADHKAVLAQLTQRDWSVLDVGCGTGRLLSLMPDTWKGSYLGIDISPDLLRFARMTRPFDHFLLLDAKDLDPAKHGPFDVAIGVMVRHMLRTHAGEQRWLEVEAGVKRVSKRQLWLEPQEVR